MGVQHGPGYRLYFLRRGDTVVLLCGGDRDGQQRNNIRKMVSRSFLAAISGKTAIPQKTSPKLGPEPVQYGIAPHAGDIPDRHGRSRQPNCLKQVPPQGVMVSAASQQSGSRYWLQFLNGSDLDDLLVWD